MSQKGDILQYNRLQELYQDLGMPIGQDAEFTIHSLLDIHDTASYKSPVFRANYYSFVFIKQGEGNYTTDHQTFEYVDRTVYFTNPGHLKAFEFYHLEDAYLVTLSEEFLKNNVHQDIFEEFPFLLAETIPPQTFDESGFAEIELLYQQILKEDQGQSGHKYRIIGSLFVVILLKLKEQFWSDYHPLKEGDRSSLIVKNFKRLLEQHYRELAEGQIQTQFKAKDYAEVLHLNPSYFSTVIKSKTGSSVSQWISDKTLNQAKALLLHSSASIKEIGFQLGFSETAHFSNFFKKHTGITPTAFRVKNNA
ncbi:MAG TPA: AraC family transcriptional regulator [Cytophagales bacterium]|nr:AraC family transcriptional regulator [Cytophagales bacterium]HAA20544.1 AraC family transcriptional regulator [Cytophagales bacterium]HAP59023.1 AraC family transcriptional regulator [Cytophagales bacterium]